MTRYAAFGAVSFLALVSCGQPATDVATTDTSLIPPLVIERSEPPDWSRVPPATTTTTPPRRASRSAVRPRSRSVEPPSAGRAASSDIAAILACIRRYEGGYEQVHGSGRHYGAYGFDMATWRGAVARAGYPEWSDDLPHQAPPAVQDAAAAQLYRERGFQPWPPASRNCR